MIPIVLGVTWSKVKVTSAVKVKSVSATYLMNLLIQKSLNFIRLTLYVYWVKSQGLIGLKFVSSRNFKNPIVFKLHRIIGLNE